MTERKSLSVVAIWLVLYRMLASHLLFPLAYEHLSKHAFYAMRLAVSFLLLALALSVSWKFLFEQYCQLQQRKKKILTVTAAVICLMAVQAGFSFLMKASGSSLFAEEASAQQYLNENLFGYVLSAVLISPVFEELVFRVCLFDLIRRRTSVLTAAVSANLLFGLSHVSSVIFQMKPGIFVLWIMYFLCGSILQYVYLKTGYFAAVITHSVFNLLSVIV